MDEQSEINFDEHSLAWELLRELKSSAKRWFIISMIELVIIFILVGGVVWYLSLPIEENNSVTQESEGDSNTMIGIGGNSDGIQTNDKDLQKTQDNRK